MIVLLKMHASSKIFDKICLKTLRDTFCFQYEVFDQGTGGLNFLVRVISNRMGKFKLFGLQGDHATPPTNSPQ